MDRRTFVASGLVAAGASITTPAALAATSGELRPSLAFHNSFWVNLHHRLYRQSVATIAVRSGERLTRMAPQLYGELSHLSSANRAAWDAAMAVYEKHYAAKDLLFDESLSSCYVY